MDVSRSGNAQWKDDSSRCVPFSRLTSLNLQPAFFSRWHTSSTYMSFPQVVSISPCVGRAYCTKSRQLSCWPRWHLILVDAHVRSISEALSQPPAGRIVDERLSAGTDRVVVRCNDTSTTRRLSNVYSCSGVSSTKKLGRGHFGAKVVKGGPKTIFLSQAAASKPDPADAV